ncbi:MAG TPA: FAD-dependent oxidoreductase [Oryzihumus sp.]|nr:FAD-dependent oxidoreductase [Oryzihumus sp.]
MKAAPSTTISHWWDDLGPAPRRHRLDGDTSADICIVGAGLTGLWTAYYLLRDDPALRVVILEAEHAGFGASGRNGGWLTGAVAGPRRRYARRGGRHAVLDLQRAMHDGVDEVLAVLADEGIAADAVKAGTLRVATTPAQAARLRAHVEGEYSWGLRPGDLRLLGRDELEERVRVHGARLGAFSPHGARVHPAKLVRGLAQTVERRGATLFEGTPATAITPGEVRTPYGAVRARVVVRATEGFTGRLPGLRRRWLPMNSSMLVTEPLGPGLWQHIGWHGQETLSDFAHAYAYLQRTADGRIAIGGRGVPYAYAGRFAADGITPASTVRALTDVLHRLFPGTVTVPVARSWSGVLAVPRDWCPGVGYDHGTGLAWAGGFVGQGLTAANVAGRTLTDLICGRRTRLTDLPWVGWHSPTWEPEPLRWLGVQGMYAAYRHADRQENRSGRDRSAFTARLADRISGR